MITSTRAQINELMERLATMANSAMGRMNSRLGLVLCAARNATGTPSTSAMAVPRVAMLIVSHNGFHSTAA